MKNITKLTTAALLGALALGVVAPIANANTEPEKEVTGKGVIRFDQSNPEIPEVTPPGKDEPEIDEPGINPDKGALMIVSVTDLDFDTHSIPVGNADREYFAKPFTTKETGTEKDVTMAHFVRYMDIRADGQQNHHSITAQLTSPFTHETNTNSTLEGASIIYNDISILPVTPTPTAQVPQNGVQTSVEISDEPVEIVNNNQDADGGRGLFDLVFGYDENDNYDDYDSVSLKVPAAVNMQEGVYTGEVTWTIGDAR